MAPLR
jgi:hypothetical protein